VFEWPGKTLDLSAAHVPKVRSVSLVASDDVLEFKQINGLKINLPPEQPDPDISVIRLRLE
jgi:hypothetical protein